MEGTFKGDKENRLEKLASLMTNIKHLYDNATKLNVMIDIVSNKKYDTLGEQEEFVLSVPEELSKEILALITEHYKKEIDRQCKEIKEEISSFSGIYLTSDIHPEVKHKRYYWVLSKLIDIVPMYLLYVDGGKPIMSENIYDASRFSTKELAESSLSELVIKEHISEEEASEWKALPVKESDDYKNEHKMEV